MNDVIQLLLEHQIDLTAGGIVNALRHNWDKELAVAIPHASQIQIALVEKHLKDAHGFPETSQTADFKQQKFAHHVALNTHIIKPEDL